MAGPKQPPAHDDAGARPDGAWREEEKRRGAPTDAPPGTDAGAAGDPVPKGGYGGGDRAATEAAAANIAGADDTPPPDPDTVIVGGLGHRSMGGSATEPEPEDPQAPRNPL